MRIGNFEATEQWKEALAERLEVFMAANFKSLSFSNPTHRATIIKRLTGNITEEIESAINQYHNGWNPRPEIIHAELKPREKQKRNGGLIQANGVGLDFAK